MIVINFKSYKVGKEVVDLVRTIEIHCNKAVIAVPSVYLKDIVKETSLDVYAQHVDFIEKGKGTGFVIPESLVDSGVKGSLLNHAEHQISMSNIKKTIERCNTLRLKLVVCVDSIEKAEKIKKLKPYGIAFEDPKLIGTGKSVTSYDANDIKKFVKILEGSNIIPLCGAGISSGEDVKAALSMGCKGVLVSSIIANSQNPEKFLKEVGQYIK